ncbi:DsbA family protein [Nonomuraea sp. NPDC004186]
MWFDPKCPWAWNASRWLLEVEQVRDVQARFHVMSLAILNERRDDLEDWYREWLGDTRAPVRVAIAAEQTFGNGVLSDLYTALGNLIHHVKMPIGRELFTKALVAVGLPERLADAADSAEYDEALLASHRAGLDPVGENLGTPVIHVPTPDGSVNAFFGPVVTPAPRGEAAGRLWDGILLTTATDGFFELKRGRTRSPQVG